jgi:hypothetical protein
VYLAYTDSDPSQGSIDTPNTSWELEIPNGMQFTNVRIPVWLPTLTIALDCHTATTEKQERGWEEEEAERQAALNA